MNPHLLAYALSTPWALMPERMAAYAGVLAAHYAGQLPPAGQQRAASEQNQAEVMAARGASAGPGGIAVIPVMGAIVEWAHQIDMCEGGTSARSVQNRLAEAEADPNVGQVLMVYSTPGGSVYGIQELGDTINRVKASKPVIGVAQSLAASAGYWALSQCTEAYVAPGGEVGSIGVYSGYENIKVAMDKAGVSFELFAAGKYKIEMSPFGDGISEEARAFQIQRTGDYYAMFTKAVAKGRGVPIDAVRNGMGEGRVLGAEAALAANMVDGIMTMEEVLKKMMRSARAASAPRRASALNRDIDALELS